MESKAATSRLPKMSANLMNCSITAFGNSGVGGDWPASTEGSTSVRTISARRLHIEFPHAQPFHLLRVTMVKETTGPGVQCCNRGDVIRAQFKVEHIEILSHSFFANRLCPDHDAALRHTASFHRRHSLSAVVVVC